MPSGFEIVADQVEGLGARLSSLAAEVPAVADRGSTPSTQAVGGAALAEAIGDARHASRRRMEEVGDYVEGAGEHLAAVARMAEALDRALAGII